MYAILDSATEFVAIEGHECAACSGQTFDIRPGLKKGDAGIAADFSDVPYGLSQIKGKWGFETICIALS